MKKKPGLLILVLACFNYLYSQDSTKNAFSWNVYLENYYSFDFNRPVDHEKAAFIFNYHRHNEFNINLLLGSISYHADKVRTNLALMAGTYPEKNLASEPALLKNIYEANIGIKLARDKNLWIDAGIFPSHIGFESAISKDNWTLSRSLLAETSPYYEAGTKFSYTTNEEKWLFSALLLNGWQRIRRPEANNSVAVGTQVSFKPSGNLLLNSSTFIGNDKTDSARKWRYFHNLFLVCRLSASFSFTAGFDYGLEQKTKNSSTLNRWYSPILILRYSKKDWAFAARSEYYSDNNGVIVSLVNGQPFQMMGYSLNLDKNIGKHALFKVEARYLRNSTPYFQRELDITASDFIFTTSLLFHRM